ncbi:MAG: paraquat-inducible protein A [Mangrovicoccus sp.]
MAHDTPGLTAREAQLIGCRHCGRVWPKKQSKCGLCGATLHSRYPQSFQKLWAWWIAGLICYIPANLYPMLQTEMLGATSASTIIGGVVDLVHHHAYFVAFVVFFASVCIPVAKFGAIAWVAISLQMARKSNEHAAHQLHRTHEIVEFVGRWSMIDVFVVAILSALVQISVVVQIHPGLAAISFALSVVFTMLSALSLDPRLIYDLLSKPVGATPND